MVGDRDGGWDRGGIGVRPPTAESRFPGNWFTGSRILTHLFNSEQDVDSLVAALNIELA